MLSKTETSQAAGRERLGNIQASVHEIDSVHVRIEVTVPAEVVRAKADKRFAVLARQAEVPGFRRGRVPRPILEKHFWPQMKNDVEWELVTESIEEVARRERLRWTGGLRVVSTSLTDVGTFTCKVVLEVFPKITDVRYQGLEISVPRVKVGERDVDRAVEELRERHVTLTPIEDRDTVEPGDVVAVAVSQGSGEPAAGKKRETLVWLREPLDPDSSLATLLGHRVGQAVTVDDGSQQHEGNVRLVRIEKIYRRNVPCLDDEFAKTVSSAETLAELRSQIAAELEVQAQKRQNAAIEAELRHALAAANAQVVAPPTLVAKERERLLAAYEAHLGSPEGKARRLLERNAALMERIEDEARKRVIAELVLHEIAEARGIAVTEEEIDITVDQMAKSGGIYAREIRQAYEREDARRQLREELRLSRALDLVRNSARVKELEESEQIAAGTGNG